MKKTEDKSYGIIPLRRNREEWEVFLVHHKKGHWSFPKGHPEKGESSFDCATRELLEETGFRITQFLDYPSVKESYEFQRGDSLVSKHNEYFLALVEGELLLQDEELVEGAWVALSEAKGKATFPEAKRVCVDVEERCVGKIELNAKAQRRKETKKEKE